jgi:mannose-6-phosphate isomerase-like protein (cupin superfamily)
MTVTVPGGSPDLEYAKKGGVYVPNEDGATTWFNGDLYAIMLSGGRIGLVEAMVPPGGGPPPHIHERTDETFYVAQGDLEFLIGDKTFTASTGDVVFLPRGNVHRFHNPGIRPATLVFIYTLGGAEAMFVEGGDSPVSRCSPWGPERIDERMLLLLSKHDTVLPPQ